MHCLTISDWPALPSLAVFTLDSSDLDVLSTLVNQVLCRGITDAPIKPWVDHRGNGPLMMKKNDIAMITPTHVMVGAVSIKA